MAIAGEVSPGEHGLQDGDGWRGDGDGGDDRPEMIRAELVRRLSPGKSRICGMKGSERAPPGGARFVVTGQRRGGQQVVTSRTRRGGRTSEGGAGPLFLRCPHECDHGGWCWGQL